MKALKLFLLILANITTVYADEQLLAEISAKLTKAELTSGQFSQEKQLKFLRNKLVSTGSFVYAQTKGVIWKTLTPVTSLILVDDSRLMTAQGEQAVPAAFGQVFKALLGGDLAYLSGSFTISGTTQAGVWQVELVPKDDFLKKIFTKIQLAGHTELDSLALYEANGNITRTNFLQIVHPKQLNQEQEADFAKLNP